MTKALNAAVVGCGNISREHFMSLKAMNVNIVAAVDIEEARARERADAFGGAVFTDYRKMLEQCDVDIVHICTPHDAHAHIAIDCLNAGKRVLSEKPIAHDLDEAHRMVEADDGRLGIVFQNRYNQSSRIAYEVCQDGFLGDLKCLKADVSWRRDAAYYDSGAWRGRYATEGGGVLINQAIHTVDLARWFGGAVSTVRGKVSTDALYERIEVEDSAHFRMVFKSGAICTFHATLGYAVDAPPEIELQFERGVLRMRGDFLWRMAEDGGMTMLSSPSGNHTPGKAYWGTGHAQLIEDFYNCAADGRKFWIDGMEGLKTLQIVKGVYRSSSEHCTVEL